MINLNNVSYQYNGAAVQPIQNLSLPVKKENWLLLPEKVAAEKQRWGKSCAD